MITIRSFADNIQPDIDFAIGKEDHKLYLEGPRNKVQVTSGPTRTLYLKYFICFSFCYLFRRGF